MRRSDQDHNRGNSSGSHPHEPGRGRGQVRLVPVKPQFEPIHRSIPAPPGCTEMAIAQASADPRPRDVLSIEELEAFAAEVKEMADDVRYQGIADRLLIDLERREAASRRIPPGYMRPAE